MSASAITLASVISAAALIPDRLVEPNTLFVMLLMVVCASLFNACRNGPLKGFNYAAFVSRYC
jgi:hypothetical protein